MNKMWDDIADRSPHLSKGVRVRPKIENGEERCIVFDLPNALLYVFNSTAAEFLELMDGSRKISEVLEVLADVYDVPKDTLKNDIEVFVNDMTDKKIVELQ